MELATKSVSFSSNDTMYRQVDGISMGSILANMFVGFYEKLLFDRFPKSYIYLRYVDDTIACFSSRNEALSFFHCLNDLHPSLTFTMDEEKKANYHVLVKRHLFGFVTCIYRKLTFTGLYLSCDAFAPKSRKVNLIVSHSGLLRFVRITRLKANLNRLKIYFEYWVFWRSHCWHQWQNCS